MQLIPAIDLRCFVKHYLWLQNSEAITYGLHIFGDGNPGIGFCCQGSLYYDSMLRMSLPQVFGYGQINDHRRFYSSADMQLLVVVLQPFALSALMRVPAAELVNLIVDQQQLFQSVNTSAFCHLSDPTLSVSHRIGRLETFLSNLFCNRLTNNHQLIAATIAHIQQLDGQTASSQLIRFTGYGERYLEKLFQEHIGLSPKRFARITRILRYMKALNNPQQTATLTEQAYLAGFYDQAHLNHEFKRFTGVTPAVFRSKKSALALNLFSIEQD